MPRHLPRLFAQIVQYISLVRPDGEDLLRRGGFETSSGREYSWYSAIGFGQDLQYGHGTHTAGSAAGATLTTPAAVAACEADEVPGCVGGCFVATEAASAAVDDRLTWDTLCPRFDCDGLAGPCLGEDVPEMLTEHGGVARGAKLAIFDASRDGFRMWASLALNGLWDATDGTGCVLHCNPWGDYDDCFVDTKSVTFDQYMFEVGRCLSRPRVLRRGRPHYHKDRSGGRSRTKQKQKSAKLLFPPPITFVCGELSRRCKGFSEFGTPVLLLFRLL